MRKFTDWGTTRRWRIPGRIACGAGGGVFQPAQNSSPSAANLQAEDESRLRRLIIDLRDTAQAAPIKQDNYCDETEYLDATHGQV